MGFWEQGGWLMPDGSTVATVPNETEALKSGALHFRPESTHINVDMWGTGDKRVNELFMHFIDQQQEQGLVDTHQKYQFRGMEPHEEMMKRIFGSRARLLDKHGVRKQQFGTPTEINPIFPAPSPEQQEIDEAEEQAPQKTAAYPDEKLPGQPGNPPGNPPANKPLPLVQAPANAPGAANKPAPPVPPAEAPGTPPEAARTPSETMNRGEVTGKHAAYTSDTPKLPRHAYPITCEIRNEIGQVESVAHRDTMRQCVNWFTEHGVNFGQVQHKEDAERNVTYTYSRPPLRARASRGWPRLLVRGPRRKRASHVTVGQMKRFLENFDDAAPIVPFSAAATEAQLPIDEMWNAGRGQPMISIDTDQFLDRVRKMGSKTGADKWHEQHMNAPVRNFPAMHPSTERAARQKANNDLAILSRRYHASIPLPEMRDILQKHGFNPEAMDGIYTGEDGKMHEQCGPRTWVSMTWHKLPRTGAWEIVAYLS